MFQIFAIGVYVHFLCIPKENEPKEKALTLQCFLPEQKPQTAG